MPFPPGVQTVTLTAGAAGYRALDGDPYQGTIRLTPSVSRVVSATHGVIALGAENITLGASGEFTKTLLAIDAEGFSPSGWTYRVDEEFTNAPSRSYNISLPASAGTVALSSLAPVESATGIEVGADAAGTAAAAVAAHNADTTDVHGIPDTAALETQAGAASKVAAHSGATDPHGDRTWADGKFATALDLTALGGTVNNLAVSVTAIDGFLNDCLTRVTAIEQGTAWLAGLQVAGSASVSGRLSGPVAPYGVIAPSRTGPAWRKASISHIFQPGHGWTAQGAASSNLNNTAAFVRGTQCASITTDTVGGSANLRKYGMSPMDLTGKMLRLICRIDDVSKIANLNVFVGTSSMTNYYRWRLWEVAGTSQLGSPGEWITLTFGWSSVNAASGSYSISATGVPSTTAGFTDLQVQAIATNGNAFTLDVQAVEVIDATSTTFPNGVVSVVFDDGADSIWNYARPAMDTYGFQGTNYVIVGNLGAASVMTAEQNRQLQDFSGWEIGLHSYDPTVHNNRYTFYTAAQVDDDMRLGKQWLVNNGFRGEGIAYPGGEYQRTTDGVAIDSIAASYFSTGRTVLFQTGFPTETFPAGMPMRMRAVSSISSTQSGANNPTNLVAAGGLLDKCQYNAGWLILVFHKIVTGTAAAATECSVADFQTIMAGIASRNIPVVPVSDVTRLYS
jgi:hypothetical protein